MAWYLSLAVGGGGGGGGGGEVGRGGEWECQLLSYTTVENSTVQCMPGLVNLIAYI